MQKPIFLLVLLFSSLHAFASGVGPYPETYRDDPPGIQGSCMRMKQFKDVKANCAILATEGTEPQIAKVARFLERAGHTIIETKTLQRGQEECIRPILNSWIYSKDIHVIITIGGTGFSSWNYTSSIVNELTQKKIPAFGELFRYLTWEKWKHLSDEVGSFAMYTDATAGIVNSTLIFAIPRSSDAIELAMDRLIIPNVPFLLGMIYFPAGLGSCECK